MKFQWRIFLDITGIEKKAKMNNDESKIISVNPKFEFPLNVKISGKKPSAILNVNNFSCQLIFLR